MRIWLMKALLLALLWSLFVPAALANGTRQLDAGPAATQGAPVLQNPGLECSEGVFQKAGIPGLVPSGWTALLLNGNPKLDSTRIEFAGSCDGEGFIERIEGRDSLVFLSEDIETPPEPGKPFDAAVYQQVQVLPGTAYSLSGWMVSLCGGSAMPNDCPDGYYMTKLLGLDPTGGTDPLAGSVIWAKDQRNFTESRWVNLRLSATAQSVNMTVFARIQSPFRWHGNHAFVDAISLVRAPTAHFVYLPATVAGTQADIRWEGTQSPDIAAIPGGTYRLLFDVQYRQGADGQWLDWLTGQPAGSATFTAPACADTQAYDFRVRARAEQPDGSHGAWPNHHYSGNWSKPATVTFDTESPCFPRAFLPLM